MNREEKIKIEIQKLQAQSNYHKFEYSQITTYYVGLIGLLITIYLPLITNINDINLIIELSILLVGMIILSHLFLKILFEKNLNQIEKLSSRIENLYSKLLQ